MVFIGLCPWEEKLASIGVGGKMSDGDMIVKVNVLPII